MSFSLDVSRAARATTRQLQSSVGILIPITRKVSVFHLDLLAGTKGSASSLQNRTLSPVAFYFVQNTQDPILINQRT